MEQLQWTIDHEEADSQMFVLAQYIIDEHQQSIVALPDTDVLVVACYQFMSELATLNKLWLKTRTKEKKKMDMDV